MIKYTVTAIPKEKGKRKKIYMNVRDMNHIYARGTGMDHEMIRLLVGNKFKREHIDLHKYDVRIHLEEGEADEQV